ncbi:XopAF/AvrXv3 family type III secretion system effector [Xanthomonas hortorum pv. vitians]|uniref:XopAF/AvrXv3 family type III secretion system effector n=1 Tax=Xanthomonas hortorum pv. vitians TaxID=83224 RepID=A0A6V7DU87_9XANT|nr:XopAF/AvrXv3 family type III secretion system effector [Xanthomonas hortorum]MCC4627371.1 type III effector [Xanthomonas campestris pv. nigromaculans]MCC8495695.1 type III effector [Xanthomonas hortorum pv. gardneri]MCC8553797.1 type III effector [Xanthomonas hortorum pv. gardneri]MCE4300081.1 type III effector [Xanthomonas hortorum pv. vitians]MCE4305033.1 type III effector [Xanthomonas hortorum pv. vitians]
MGNCFSQVSGAEGRTYSQAYNTPPSPEPELTFPEQHFTPVDSGPLTGLRGRPTKLSHHRLAQDGDTLVMVPVSYYQEARSHPHNQIKDRSQSAFPLIDVGGANAAQGRAFAIDHFTTVKVAGFNYNVPNDSHTTHLYSTGTSLPNIPVITDGMGACIGVAFAAERIDPRNKRPMPGAKVRVFHVYPFSRMELAPKEVMKAIQRHIDEIREDGLTLRIAMHGGLSSSDSSLATASALRALFDSQQVPVEFDETCEKRMGETPLGAVINDDYSIDFITRLVATE